MIYSTGTYRNTKLFPSCQSFMLKSQRQLHQNYDLFTKGISKSRREGGEREREKEFPRRGGCLAGRIDPLTRTKHTQKTSRKCNERLEEELKKVTQDSAASKQERTFSAESMTRHGLVWSGCRGS